MTEKYEYIIALISCVFLLVVVQVVFDPADFILRAIYTMGLALLTGRYILNLKQLVSNKE